MAGPSVTHTFSNSTTADATQVNTNFTDLINGATDGTKDYTINALTCQGAATLNGNVTLGNATADDITFTGSLASSVPIKTTFSYDLGSATIGLRSIYLGSNDSAARSVRLIAGAVGTSYTFTLPTGAGTSRYRLETDGAGVTSWHPVRRSSSDLHNISLSTSVAANALTITLKSADGTDLSATNPADIVFRSSTAATGTAVTRSVTSNLTLTVSSGSTLGTVSGQQSYLYVYALDSAGTVELAVSGMNYTDEGALQSTTAEGGAGAADSATTIYSATARTNVPIRLLGRIEITETTAGTWASNSTGVALWPFEKTGRMQNTWTGVVGLASTDTAIVRFDTNALQTGSGTYYSVSSSATNGTVWTILENGVYTISISLRNATGGLYVGVLRNGSGTQLTNTASGFALATDNGYIAFWTTVAASPTGGATTVLLNRGDTIRIGMDTGVGAFSTTFITITRVGD